MFLKNDKIVIHLGGLTFFSHHDNSKSHFRLDPTAIQGWTDGVDIRRDTSVRPTSWGDFSESGRMSSRLITISGTAVAKDFYELHQMRDAFMAICSDGGYVEMSLQNGSNTRYATVTRGGKPNWIQLLDMAAAWKIDLYAPDPRIYGPVEQSPVKMVQSSAGGLKYPIKYALNYNIPVGEVSYTQPATNNGNVEAWPVMVITGNYPLGFSLSDQNGGLVTYTGQVTMSNPVTVDMAKGSVTQAGVDKSVLLTDRKWWSIQPGGIVQPLFLPKQAGPGWCDILFRDTWI